MTLPNFLHIGPDRAGTTWLHRALAQHPQVFVPSAKEVLFFDQHWNRGLDWYARHYRRARPSQCARGDFAFYLYSEDARERIKQTLPDVRLLVTPREPVSRAFSSYLYMLRQGRVSGSFIEALAHVDELIEHGRYAHYLRPYIEAFGRDRLHVALYDDLVASPAAYFSDMCRFLGINSFALPPGGEEQVLPSARPRWPWLAGRAYRAGTRVREAGHPTLVGRVKSNRMVQWALYRPYGDADRPVPDPAIVAMLRERFAPDVEALEALTGLPVLDRWGYR